VRLCRNELLSARPDYVMTHQPTPFSWGVTDVECRWLFPPEVFDIGGFDPSYAVDFWDVTNREDWSACEGVQRAVGYRGYQPGPLSPRETTVYQAITIVARGYLEGRLSPPSTAAIRSIDPAMSGA